MAVSGWKEHIYRWRVGILETKNRSVCDLLEARRNMLGINDHFHPFHCLRWSNMQGPQKPRVYSRVFENIVLGSELVFTTVVTVKTIVNFLTRDLLWKLSTLPCKHHLSYILLQIWTCQRTKPTNPFSILYAPAALTTCSVAQLA